MTCASYQSRRAEQKRSRGGGIVAFFGLPLWCVMARVRVGPSGSRIQSILDGESVAPISHNVRKVGVLDVMLYRFARRYMEGRAAYADLQLVAIELCDRHGQRCDYLTSRLHPAGVGLVRTTGHKNGKGELCYTIKPDAVHGPASWRRDKKLRSASMQRLMEKLDPTQRAIKILLLELEGVT